MNHASSFEDELACLNAQEMEQLVTTVCEQLHRLEALVGMTIVVPNQTRHADETAPRFAFFPEACDTLA